MNQTCTSTDRASMLQLQSGKEFQRLFQAREYLVSQCVSNLFSCTTSLIVKFKPSSRVLIRFSQQSLHKATAIGNSELGNFLFFHTASEEYMKHRVLGITSGLEDLGGLQWRLVVSYFAAWTLIFLCQCKGIRSSGKARNLHSSLLHRNPMRAYHVLKYLYLRL